MIDHGRKLPSNRARVEAAELTSSPLLSSIWDLESGELLRTLEGHSDTVTSVCVTAKHIISGSKDTTVR